MVNPEFYPLSRGRVKPGETLMPGLGPGYGGACTGFQGNEFADSPPGLQERGIAAGTTEKLVEIVVLPTNAVNQGQETVGKLGIKLSASKVAYLRHRLINRPRLRIGSPVRHRVEDVCQCHYPREYGNPIAR